MIVSYSLLFLFGCCVLVTIICLYIYLRSFIICPIYMLFYLGLICIFCSSFIFFYIDFYLWSFFFMFGYFCCLFIHCIKGPFLIYACIFLLLVQLLFVLYVLYLTFIAWFEILLFFLWFSVLLSSIGIWVFSLVLDNNISLCDFFLLYWYYVVVLFCSFYYI